MALMMSGLLAYGDLVPPSARDAIKAAHAAPPSDREARRSAARELYRTGDLDCRDALELVDLGDESPDCSGA
jgi:hypothetical protein